MRETSRVRGGGALAAALVIGLVGGAARAQEEAAAPASPGRDAYLQYCASCHGPGAEGDGPMAGELRARPADLTRLQARFGSPLRTRQLLDRIDGRDMARAHGSNEMPVWGRKLARDVPRTQSTEAQTRGTLLIIIDWLATIQK
jgi:mono/diheme cytochrome c family protein